MESEGGRGRWSVRREGRWSVRGEGECEGGGGNGV